MATVIKNGGYRLLRDFFNYIFGKNDDKLLKNSDGLYQENKFKNKTDNSEELREESFDYDSGENLDRDLSYKDKETNFVDTKSETDKKCPCCDGVMNFDPGSGCLVCPYCGYKEEIEENQYTQKKAEELDFNEARHTENCDWGVETKTVVCKSCGAETVYDDFQISGICPYCGSNQVIEAEGVDTIAPGGVCKFEVTEKEALSNFKSWIAKRIFCPRKAKENAKPGGIKGIYLPYWTFDADTQSRYTGKYGKDNHYTDEEGKDRVKTEWYRTSGYYEESINDELVIATTKHDKSILKGLEPFDTENNVAYKPEYVAGFGAERYSVGLKEAFNKAKEFIRNHLTNKINEKIKVDNNADRSQIIDIDTIFSNVTYKYLLLPVWISSFKYNEKVYQFMINGQTGRVSGKTPISPIRVAIAVILALIVIGLIIYINRK
ncbi:hypothetical protein [uncultured Clostridium sp.]|uniref:hypothetical protein n=1 Tax=uncultured Clostridium sp. TaxID=59620 RepID=UPI0025EA46CD|nr:hypothetical protein [uncultured Clostridium sp.]